LLCRFVFALALTFSEIAPMACRFCGQVCRCTPESLESLSGPAHRVRFEADADACSLSVPGHTPVLIDPEASDHSEHQFEVSLATRQRSARARFIVDREEVQLSGLGDCPQSESADFQESNVGAHPELLDANSTALPLQPDLDATPAEPMTSGQAAVTTYSEAPGAQASCNEDRLPEHGTFWKDEVAARLNFYRARRKPRPPKYPSLRLKFDFAANKPTNETPDTGACAASRESLALEIAPVEAAGKDDVTQAMHTATPATSGTPSETGRVIEFPRSHYDVIYYPVLDRDELADPVFETPRIVEVPEVESPAPALGGITLEPEEREPEKRPGFEIPLQSAPMSRRFMATLCDLGVVITAFILFGYIFFKITGSLPPWKEMASVSLGLLGLFWSTYQYLLLTYAGTTPGLRLAGLQLRQFDGTVLSRSLRRWRVLTSVLSGLSLGLGYAWCFLDEDALCWHDRITGTYLEVAN
jgi:uncharacterized RDD family membrane protein YckC